MSNPYISLLRTAWKYAGKERKKFVLIYGMFICANVIFSMNPLLLGWFINKAQQDSARIPHYVLMYVCCYVGLKLAEWCFHGPARTMERTLAFRLSRNFIREKYHQTLHLPAKWHQDHHSGATINRVRKAYEALREFFDKGFTYVYTLTKFVFSVTAIVYFSPLFGSIAVLMGLGTVWIISRYDKPFIKTLREVNEREHEVSSNLFDSLSNIRTVITLRLEKSMERGLMQKIRLVFRPFRRNAVINEWKWFTAEMLITLIYAVVIVGFVWQHWTPGAVFYIAGLVTLLGYVNQFTSVFQSVANQYSGLVQYQTNIAEVDDIGESYERQHRQDQSGQWPATWSKLEMNKVNFSYAGIYNESYRPASLHNLHLQIGKGKKIALIGESGSGKSTLLSLLRGLYMPGGEAELRIDGVSYPIDTIHNAVTLFPQEPEIFENTLAYNVTLGLPCSEDEIRRVCEIAHFGEVVRQLPAGLETDIKEKGVNLSGGQKQRLALARGILAAKDSQLVLLDEPTSSVDPTTEMRIYQNLFRTFAGKAVISSIHRLHLLEQFDYIYILEKGRIIDEGSFEQLMANSVTFKTMWDHQNGRSFVAA
ncbi:MAG: ABC transporter ATP-binding protein [Bacteroidetes bacterium]|nr:ABC transporter ATP-binding protein [Bacteroidota bacterium]